MSMFGKKKTFITPKLAMMRAAKEKETLRISDNGRNRTERNEWRKTILPQSIATAWDNAEQLAPLLLQSLTQGIYTDILESAEHLRKMDLHTERSAVVLAILYIKLQRPGDAERVLKEEVLHMRKTGGYLANLSRISKGNEEPSSVQSRYERSIATLARGVE